MRKLSMLVIALMLTTGMFTVLGCGGGGGGGGGEISLNESVNYSGETLPAVIDTTSAVQLALDATIGTKDADGYGGLLFGFFLGAAGSDVNSGLGGIDLAKDPGQAINFVRGFMGSGGSVQSLSVSAEPAPVESLRVQCESVVIGTGSGGGTMSMEVCAEPVSRTLIRTSMTLIFDQYINGTDYQDGELEIQGTIDTTIGDDGDFVGPVAVIFRDLVTILSLTGENSYVDGWAIYTIGTNTVSFNYNMTLIDSSLGEAYWMDDYTIAIDHVNDQVTLSGRFYDPALGYVDLTTETVLSWNVDLDSFDELQWIDDHPIDGTVKLTGIDGYWISITFSAAGYYVDINYTGDDASDITVPDIGVTPWT